MIPTDLRIGLQAEEGALQEEDGQALPLPLATKLVFYLEIHFLNLFLSFVVLMFIVSFVFVLRGALLTIDCIQGEMERFNLKCKV